MQLFFVDRKNEDDKYIKITGTDVNHIKNVLRMKIGEEAMISDSQYFYISRIISFSKEEVIFEVQEKVDIDTELPVKISLFQCLPKGDKMDTICMKTVEMGVSTIIPVASARCVVKLDEKKAKKKIIRWQQIAEGAAKQSKRGIIPGVESVMQFEEALDAAEKLDMIICPYENAKDISYTAKVLGDIGKVKSLGIFIGPEGGFDESEIERLKKADAKIVTLGKRILRTETAGLYIMSVISYLLESQV